MSLPEEVVQIPVTRLKEFPEHRIMGLPILRFHRVSQDEGCKILLEGDVSG